MEYPKWVYLDGDGIIVDDEKQHDVAKSKGFGDYGTVSKKPAPKKKATKKAK